MLMASSDSIETRDGGSAFPVEQGHCPDGTWNQTFEPGMTLRDYFAANALVGMTASPELMQVVTAGSILDGTASDRLSKRAFQIADAMLKARGS
jgi:hypothetical protein